MDDTLFFVGVKDPVEVRKELLLGSKNILNSLKRYEQFVQLKEEKVRVSLELQRVFDEILVLNKKLRNHLPKVPVSGASEEPLKEELRKQESKTIPKAKLDLLDDELARVERRLNSLE